MKKLLSIGITAIMSMSILASCAGNTQKQDDGKLKVVTTIFPPYDFVREIAGDNADVDILLKAGEESHSYEPTAKDIIKIQDSDLFIYTGGENDYWVEEVLKSLDDTKTKAVKLIDMVETIDAEDEHNHNHDEEDSHEHDEDLHTIDEHVWTSPKNAMLISKSITTSLKQLDGENAGEYQENLESYIQKLQELDNEFRQIVDTAKRKTIVVGDRFPFRYLARDYGIEYYSAFDMCQTESDASAQTVASLIDTVKTQQIPVVIKMEMSKGDIANTVAKPSGAKVLQMHSCHNLTKDEWKENKTYLQLMEQNAQVLKEALN